jgi:hypothetical protein
MSSMMSALGGGTQPPSLAPPVAPPVFTPPPLRRLAAATTPRRHADLESLAAAAALPRTPVATAPVRRRTPPPPVRYNDQTLTQMDWEPPPTEPDGNLPPGVTTVRDASGKKVYRLKVGQDVFWFLSRKELEGKPAAQDIGVNGFDEPGDDDADDMSSRCRSPNLLEGEDDVVANNRGRGRVSTLEVVPNTQATIATAAASLSDTVVGDADGNGVLTQVTPEPLTQPWTPPMRTQAYSQLSQLTQSETQDPFYDDEENQHEHLKKHQ